MDAERKRFNLWMNANWPGAKPREVEQHWRTWCAALGLDQASKRALDSRAPRSPAPKPRRPKTKPPGESGDE